MTRIIKFRAWNKEENEMEIAGETNACINFFGSVIRNDFGNSPLILMQFTGLLDKNGKEIYFDDVVRFSYFAMNEDFSYGGTAVISRTMNGGAGILADFDDKEEDKYWAVTEGGVIEDIWEDPKVWEMEIIGNVYENPELI